CRRNRLDLDVQRVPCERGNTQDRPGGEVRLDELVFHFAEGGQVVFDIDVVGYQFHQVLEAQAFVLQNRAQALEGHAGLLLGGFGNGPVGPNADLAGNEHQTVGGHCGRVLEEIKNLVAAESGVVFGQAQALDVSHSIIL